MNLTPAQTRNISVLMAYRKINSQMLSKRLMYETPEPIRGIITAAKIGRGITLQRPFADLIAALDGPANENIYGLPEEEFMVRVKADDAERKAKIMIREIRQTDAEGLHGCFGIVLAAALMWAILATVALCIFWSRRPDGTEKARAAALATPIVYFHDTTATRTPRNISDLPRDARVTPSEMKPERIEK